MPVEPVMKIGTEKKIQEKSFPSFPSLSPSSDEKREKLNEMRFMGNSQSRFGSNKVGIRTRAPAEKRIEEEKIVKNRSDKL